MDWASIIEDLRRAGMTQVQIAGRVGCSQPTISDIASSEKAGKRGPSFRIADALIRLHREVVGRGEKVT